MRFSSSSLSVATDVFLLQLPEAHTANQMFANNDRQDDHRGHQHAGGGADSAPVEPHGGQEVEQSDRSGGRLALGQDEGQQELVDRLHDVEDYSRGNTR